jgi:hypothetical protein
MASAGFEVIDVPFTTMKNLIEHPGHPCCDRQINDRLSAKEGILRYRRSPNAATLRRWDFSIALRRRSAVPNKRLDKFQ